MSNIPNNKRKGDQLTAEEWNNAAQVINELDAKAYIKPQQGIPKSDLHEGVQESLDSADSAYQKPDTGIPASDLASGVIPDISEFITKSVNDLTNYYLKSETYTKAEVAALIGAIQNFHYEIYTTLPASGESNVLYLIGPTGTGSDRYQEFVYSDGAFTMIGDTSINLSGYVTTSALNTALAEYTTTSDLTTLLDGKLNAPDTAGTSGQVLTSDGQGGHSWQTPQSGGTATDVQVNGTSITSNNVANIITNTAYNASSNKIATMSDLPSVPVTDVTVGGTSVVSSGTAVIPSIPTVPTTLSSFTDDLGTSPTHTHSQYLTSHQDITGKADKVASATSGNFAALDSNGNLTDSGHKHSDYLTSHQDLSNYVQKSQTAGLLKNDGTVDTTSYGTYSKPSGGIPVSDLASGVIPNSVVNATSQQDGTVVLTMVNGDTITIDLNHVHPQYYSKVRESIMPQGGFLPDVVYSLGVLSSNTTFSLAPMVVGNTNHYYWTFSTATTAITVTWPTRLIWANGSEPTIAVNKHYEISILDNFAVYMETSIQEEE